MIGFGRLRYTLNPKPGNPNPPHRERLKAGNVGALILRIGLLERVPLKGFYKGYYDGSI